MSEPGEFGRPLELVDELLKKIKANMEPGVDAKSGGIFPNGINLINVSVTAEGITFALELSGEGLTSTPATGLKGDTIFKYIYPMSMYNPAANQSDVDVWVFLTEPNPPTVQYTPVPAGASRLVPAQGLSHQISFENFNEHGQTYYVFARKSAGACPRDVIRIPSGEPLSADATNYHPDPPPLA